MYVICFMNIIYSTFFISIYLNVLIMSIVVCSVWVLFNYVQNRVGCRYMAFFVDKPLSTNQMHLLFYIIFKETYLHCIHIGNYEVINYLMMSIKH